MKILLTSYVFAPSVGGIETVSGVLAAEFVRAGHEVKVVTKTDKEDDVERPYEVWRNPSFSKMMELTRWCDVFFQNNISLELAWPLLLVRRPWVVGHHTLLDHEEGVIRWRSTLKKSVLRLARNAVISRFLAGTLPVPCTVVGNPYANDVFRLWPGEERKSDLIYLGRLVSDKGIDLIVTALDELKGRGLKPSLTIVGLGPEAEPLRVLAERLQVSDQIDFAGPKMGLELAQVLNRHRIMIVPSRWAEPFGVVVLEGIACGCAVVTSDNGGLPEALGPCGVTFKTDHAGSLADVLEKALREPGFRERVQQEAPAHLARFEPTDVASRYLRLFEEARSAGGRG